MRKPKTATCSVGIESPFWHVPEFKRVGVNVWSMILTRFILQLKGYRVTLVITPDACAPRISLSDTVEEPNILDVIDRENMLLGYGISDPVVDERITSLVCPEGSMVSRVERLRASGWVDRHSADQVYN